MSLFKQIKKAIRGIVGYPMIRNANKVDEVPGQKRALLIYLTKPYRLAPDDPEFLTHQNLRQCMEIAEVMGELGYLVDVADVHDANFVPKSHYDLIVSHRLDLKIPRQENQRRVYLASGPAPQFQNRAMEQRQQWMERTKGVRLHLAEQLSEDCSYLDGCDAIFCFGNEYVADTWREIFKGPVLPFNNYPFPCEAPERDYSEARNHFLFFASGSQLRKGLPLLLEIFPKYPDVHLHVCSLYEQERDLCWIYEHELYHAANIHEHSIVRLDSEVCNEIFGQCAFVILPSCAEGQPGSVVQCMAAGLIPLVTPICGIDPGMGVHLFPADDLEKLEALILEMSKVPQEVLKNESDAVSERAKHLPLQFKRRWREMLTAVVDAV